MAKNKEYHFYNDSGFSEKVEALGFKRAVKSVQNKIKDKWVIIEYLTKKGKEVRRFVKLPIGRKKRLVR